MHFQNSKQHFLCKWFFKISIYIYFCEPLWLCSDNAIGSFEAKTDFPPLHRHIWQENTFRESLLCAFIDNDGIITVGRWTYSMATLQPTAQYSATSFARSSDATGSRTICLTVQPETRQTLSRSSRGCAALDDAGRLLDVVETKLKPNWLRTNIHLSLYRSICLHI